MFEFSITITEQDYMLLTDYHLSYTKSGRAILRSYRLLTPIVTFMALAIMWIEESDSDTLLMVFLACIIMSLIMAALTKKYILKKTAGRVKQMKKQGKLPYSPNAHLVFAEDNFVETTDSLKSEYSYEAIEKIVSTPHGIYLYTKVMRQLIIPTLYLSKDNIESDFIAFLRSKCSDNVVFHELKAH